MPAHRARALSPFKMAHRLRIEITTFATRAIADCVLVKVVSIRRLRARRPASLGVLVVFVEGMEPPPSRFTGARSGDFGGLFQ